MRGLNKAYLIGRIDNEPELKTGEGGTTVCAIMLAVPRHMVVEGEAIEALETHRLVASGKDAVFLAENAHKGNVLAVECALRSGKWTDKDSRTHYVTSLVCERVLWLNTNPKGV